MDTEEDGIGIFKFNNEKERDEFSDAVSRESRLKSAPIKATLQNKILDLGAPTKIGWISNKEYVDILLILNRLKSGEEVTVGRIKSKTSDESPEQIFRNDIELERTTINGNGIAFVVVSDK